ncbi:MAG: SNF2 helicase associated domain-containing protein, partial [Clostridiales Family XIII bacterium]|nr:SNF2 helicase associated domain-containing protein [Clostridiales Family XIII bacterium]
MNYSVLLDRADIPTINAGMELDFGKKVSAFSFHDRRILADVDDPSQSRLSTVEIFFEDDACTVIEYAECTCSGFLRSGADCCHIIAGAITAQRYAKQGKSFRSDQEDALQEDAVGDDVMGGEEEEARFQDSLEATSRTSEHVLSVLVNAEIRRANRMSREAEPGEQPLLFLEPTLHLTYYEGNYLTVKVGHKRMYVVKDIVDFVGRYILGETIALGKKDEVQLHRGAFHTGSLPLLDFVLRHYRHPASRRSESLRSIDFTNTVMDEYLKLFQDGDKITIAEDRYRGTRDSTYTVREKDCPLHCTLEREYPMARVSMTEKFVIIAGLARVYLLKGDTLYKCSPEYSERCGYFLRSINSLGGSFQIARKDLPNFFASIIHETEDFLHFDIDDAYMDEQPAPLVTKVWFDVLEEGGIKAKMVFSYGRNEHPAFRQKYLHETLDLAGEYAAERILQKYLVDD